MLVAGAVTAGRWHLRHRQSDNVFHHSSNLQIACHLQADATPCWSPITVLDEAGNDFSTSGQPGIRIDQSAGKLYVYATRTSDQTGGVACVDLNNAGVVQNPFCGFTALTAQGDSPCCWSSLSDPVMVGTRWYAFNYTSGSDASGARNRLLCFDVAAKAHAPQPYAVGFGAGNMTTSLPSPAIAAIGTHIVIPVDIDGFSWLACFDASTQSACAGRWPLLTGFDAWSFGAPFPMTDAKGSVIGFCLPSGSDPCYDLTGLSVPTPAGMTGVINANDEWNGPAFTLGPRAYVPNGNVNAVECYDYSTNAACSNSPKTFSGMSHPVYRQCRSPTSELYMGQRRWRVRANPELRRLHGRDLRRGPDTSPGVYKCSNV